ncbi:class I SAM-dependent methyltransferase [Thermoactinomyces mirandus]|uniref:Class I SAM-dependent methyltransferase n=1 Tax=Thermoactinomyces mirandus TaxID=2756294 RepID=A0A7W1XUD2_9BACL|nr:class I SAM-dependent methyltransferase [Thermoactinomyces mirandus]MBA4603160.1 class I SAM-dependent methyltransferase [Thermoactinomyces mirandus]
MSDHYFSAKPEAQEEGRRVRAVLLGQPFTFYTDAGVFSKKGIDFGSRLLIETVKIEPRSHVLDLGCGYGAIGIAVAKTVPHVKVTMVDINERAIRLAKENTELNQVENQVKIMISDRFSALEGEAFDHILLNPPIRTGKKTVYAMFEEASKALVSGGSLWIVIRKQQGAVSAKKELEQLFSSVDVVDRKKGYWVIRSRND